MIREGDRLQASEKIWGAVAHKIRGIARKRGWSWTRHNGYERVVAYLRQNGGDLDLLNKFHGIERFHANFYDDTMVDQSFADGLAAARELIVLLEEADKRLRDDSPMPFGVRRLTAKTRGERQRPPRAGSDG